MIRPLRPSHVDDCMRLKEAAGWNQTRADWETVLRLQPDGCWGFEADGRAVASATAVAFGRDLAWIGMVLTLPEYRRQGIARRLMERALEWCSGRGVETVKLDATDLGRPLYLSLGFVDEEPVERWGRDPAPAAAGQRYPPGVVPALDRESCGVDRTAMLDALASAPDSDAAAGTDGYALSRPGSNARFLGPAAARGPEAARPLIEDLLSRRPNEPWFWDLLPESSNAPDLARSLGFRPLRRLSRMSLGGPRPLGDPGLVWATAGFEYG